MRSLIGYGNIALIKISVVMGDTYCRIGGNVVIESVIFKVISVDTGINAKSDEDNVFFMALSFRILQEYE